MKANTTGGQGLRLDALPGGRFIAVDVPLQQSIRTVGMKLEPARGLVPVLVITPIEHPTED